MKVHAPGITKGLVNSSKEKHGGLMKKNTASFGYYCPDCQRVFSVRAKVEATIAQVGPSHYGSPDEPAYCFPMTSIISPDAINMLCMCGAKMVACDPVLAQYVATLKDDFGFVDIEMNQPVAATGKSYNASELIFRDLCDSEPMQLLVDALITLKPMKFGGKYGDISENLIKASIINESDFTTTITLVERTPEVESLLKHPSSHISIEEILDYDVAMEDRRTRFYYFIDSLIKQMYTIKKDRENEEKDN